MSDYNSSIINKYGDRDNVPKDCKTLYDIINRQGTSLLIDCIAEYVGTLANKQKYDSEMRPALIISLVTELKDALNERL